MFSKDTNKIKFRMPYSIPQIPVFPHSLEKDIKKMELVISKTIKKLTQHNISIIVCQHYLDSIVNEYFIKKMNTLEQINNLSIEQIQNTFLRRATDKKEFQSLLELIDVQITSTKSELDMLIDLYNNANPLNKGKLDVDNVTGTEETNDE